ncbi:MAG TPA: hypothetical protein VLF66_17830 [Thermoanaerobaculia bacterium]|nr:hypothetical protein [Thermoanaerobaculia bacterium]
MIFAVLTHVDRIHGWLGTLPSWTRTRPRARPRPDRNPDALASYLFGMLSPLPLLGLLFGVPAVILGLKGLRYARLHPKAGGALQSRIGIALGTVFAVAYLSLTAFLLGVLVV